jgi:hypothetical protein
MATDIIIKLKKSLATVTTVDTVEVIDWTSALIACATEVQLLNQFVDGDQFPRPIKANPLSTQPEGFLGDVNTPPDALGFVTVRLADYSYFDLAILDILPAKPTTFSFGYAQTGQFI